MNHKNILVSLLLIMPFCTSAAIYKWVDEQGNIHYGEERPLTTEAEKIKLDKAPSEISSTYKRPSLKKKSADQDATTDDAVADDGIPKEEKARLCTRAQDILKKMTTFDRIVSKDKDGNREVLSEEMKQKRIKEEQKAVNKYCK